MIKIISFIRRNPALSQAEFEAYWRDVHAPLVRSLLPGLREYVGCFPADDSLAAFQADAVVELAFDDRDTMDREMGHPRFQSDARVRSSERLMDMDSVRNIIVEVQSAL